ncbi:hypothetical protein [Streptomyces tendae]|uniref:hypothetical protein n=1 Tax=Streptomyces tendae TaxID=1932 RepID=UPI0036AD3AC5
MSAGTGDRGGLFVDGTGGGRTDGVAPGGTRRAAAGVGRAPAGGGAAVLFSDGAPSHSPAAASGTPAESTGVPAEGTRSTALPRARTGPPRGGSRRERKSWPKVAQRIVPDDLQPEVLRLELTELGDAFRAYQRRPEPDLAVLAALHDRKARAFASWAAVTGDASLREEAERAATAARTTREMNANRRGVPLDGEGPAVERLLTPGQGVHARTVLEHVRLGSPLPGAEARLAVLMLTLRAARAGTGNVTGQDLGGWLQDDAERVLRELVDAGWLRLPEDVSADDALTSRPEEPTQVTVPSLLAAGPRPFVFGKVTRARLSGWAQKVVGDRKLRKKKAGAATRLLAVYTAAHSRPGGCLGGVGEDAGLALDEVAQFCGLRPEQVAEHAALLAAAGWLEEADTADGRLRGRLAERVLPLSGLL